jgi:tetratricopeptide (TPR) repeat protein
VWEKLGSLLLGCGQYDGAIGALDEAVSAYRAVGDRDGMGRAVAQIGWAYVRAGGGSQGLRRVEALLMPDELTRFAPPTRTALLCAHAVLLFALNRYDEQLASARQASALARPAGDTEAMAQSMRQEGLALVQLGRFDEALPVTLETIRLAELAGDLDSYSAALNDTAAVYRIRGELRSSWDYSARSVEVAKRLGDPTAIAFFAGSHGDNAYLLGDWAAARHSFAQSVAVARDMGSSWVTAYALYSLGQLELAQGRDEEAARLLDEAVTCAERDHDLQALRCVQAVLAERDLVRGAASDALQRLQPLLDPATANEKDSIALLPFVAWSRLSLGDLAGAAESLSQCQRRAEAAGNRLVALDVLLAQARLFIRWADWSEAERALDHALASAEAMAYPYGQAKARFIYGQLRAAAGDRAQARDQYEQALALCDRLGEKLYRAQIERALTQLTNM